jgi:ubiquitin-activating enzyme E1
VTKVKQPTKAEHRSLSECMTDPGNFLLSDFSKIERSNLLHVAFQVLEKFVAKASKLPTPGSKADIEAFAAAFSEFNAALVCLHSVVCFVICMVTAASACSQDLTF